MKREEILEKLTEVFRDVFDNEELKINEETVIEEIEDYSSLLFVTLVGTLSDEFDRRFSIKGLLEVKTIAQLIDLIME